MTVYRRRKSGPCHRRQRRGMRLILCPSLLLLLAESESHGYGLCAQLVDFGFDLEGLDSSIVYRDLRGMEEMGLIDSYWDNDSKGPRRRVYRIQEEGRTRLTEWIEIFGDIQGRMTKINKRYQAL